MAATKLLFIHPTTGLSTEHTSTADITFQSYAVSGSGPILNANLSMASGLISSVGQLSFTTPSAQGILQTASTLAADNIMGKERDNVMSTTGSIIFPTITDSAGAVDSFKVPNLAGNPTAVPTFSSTPGYMVYDSSNGLLKLWNGSLWSSDIATASSVPKTIDMTTYVSAASLSANSVVYISGEGLVNLADSDAEATGRVIGFQVGAINNAVQASVQSNGSLAGFTSLVAGSRYFLGSVAGSVTTTVASAGVIVQVGYAANSTTMNVIIQQLAARQ